MKKMILMIFTTLSIVHAESLFTHYEAGPIVEMETFLKTVCTKTDVFDYNKSKYNLHFAAGDAVEERNYKFFIYDMANIYGDDFMYENPDCYQGQVDGNLLKVMVDNESVSAGCYGDIYYPIEGNQEIKCKDAVVMKKVLRIPRTRIQIESLVQEHCPEVVNSDSSINEISAMQCIQSINILELVGRED